MARVPIPKVHILRLEGGCKVDNPFFGVARAIFMGVPLSLV